MYQIQLDSITKAYPGCVANNAVSLSVREGEIHALLGENGAGKSTLMKIIYGVVAPDAGTMIWRGQPVTVKGPNHARALGIGMVFQHFSLFETLTVLENIALSLPKSFSKDKDALKQKILDVSAKYGMLLDPDRYVHSLSIGEQQRVEIVRCLLQDVKLLILDEPTSVLTPQEVKVLFNTLQTLASEGCSILFISHKLDEVKSICTAATVLRGGVVTGAFDPRVTTVDEMAVAMVGADTPLDQHYPRATGQEVFLSLANLSCTTYDPFGVSLSNLNCQVKAGEIVGIAGVAGNGQEELLSLISGETLADDASMVCFDGHPVAKSGPGERRSLGLGFVPEERLGRGAVPDMSLADNALLTASAKGLVTNGLVDNKAVKVFAKKVVDSFNVKTASILSQAKSLSGGNLQKFIIGREILQAPKLLVCSHPTWGVDIGAAIQIRHSLIALRDQGCAVLIVSEDIDELYALCDRIGAICDGKLSPIRNTDEVSLTQLGKWMAGEMTPSNEVVETAHA